ncbi:MAG: hypothetical protein ACE5I7_20845, partial [Candidatus Binatia bacterium]
TVCAAGEPESVILTLRHGKFSRELEVSLATIRETEKNLARRERLRMRIKRARDSMSASVKQIPLQPTRLVRPGPSDVGSFFRAGGGRGGPRR